MTAILAFDLGTTALKCALHDLDGEILAQASEEYQLITPQPDAVEMDVETYWQAFKNTVARVLKESKISPSDIKALGVSAQGEPLRPMQNRLSWALKTSGHVLRIIHEHTSAPVGFDDAKAILRRESGP